MNTHTPERQAHESERRRVSQAIAKRMRCAGIGYQHKATTSRERFRDERRNNGTLRSGSYGRGLKNHFDAIAAAKSAAKLAKRHSA